MTRAVGSSYLKFITCRQREKERGVWLSRLETCLFAANNRKRVGNGFCSSLAASFERKCTRWVSVSSSSSSPAQTDNQSEEIQTDRSKTVRVRFKLHKECAFGQQFLIVGDDSVVGLWDPSDGVPLNWSEGHVWIAEIDIPSGKVIKYKFILKDDSENVVWQPGPDRVLETWLTDKTITVSEDWNKAELQNIVEEEIVDDLKNESLIDSEPLIVAENLDHPIMDNATDVMVNLAEKPFTAIVAENITEEWEKQDNLASATDDKNEESKSAEDEGVPVLVPGLISMTSDEIEEADLNEVEKYESVERRIDEIVVSTEPEETSETKKIDQKQQINGADHVMENDLQWGRRTLQKFLANFGFR